MAGADQPGKLFIGGLSAETNEKSLEAVFGKHGPIVEVLLIKDWETNKSRGFAFITFENPADAKHAARVMNGKSLDGRAIKVEQANKSSFESGGRRRPRPPARNSGLPRNLRCGSGGARGHPSCGGHLDDGGYTLSLNVSSSRERFPVKRGPSSGSEGPPPKRSAPSTQGRSGSGMGGRGPLSRGRENYGSPPRRDPVSLRRKPVSSRRDVYMSPRDDDYTAKDSYSGRVHPSSRDTKDYVPPSRNYAYCDYGHSSSWDDHSTRGYSGRVGHRGSRDRDYSEHPSGSSYRDSYESYGSSRGAPPARGPSVTYSRSSCYDDYSSTRDGYGERRGGYSSSRSDTYLSGREHGGRQERGFPPSVVRVYPAPHKSYGSSGSGASRGYGGSQSERGRRSRY